MINSTSSSELPHFPVMLDEVTRICSPNKGGVYIDCTFGGGGYSKKLLKFSKTKVIALDRDEFIIKIGQELKKKYPKRFFFHQKKFSEVNTVVENQSVDAVVFDLGLSSIQLNNLERGFSFNSREKLDMSMGLSTISAEEVVNNFSEQKLKSIIKILGEEKDASRIARNIIKTRLVKKITKVDQLVGIIKRSKKKNYVNKINPSTKTFQALRIFVNKEITELIEGAINATKILKPGGKILIVSFHSIEDKIVKYFLNLFTNSSGYINLFSLLIAYLSLAERDGGFLIISKLEGLNILFLYLSNKEILTSLFSGRYLEGLDRLKEKLLKKYFTILSSME